ncbi:MAG: (d)CMP kinase [Oscillospiraceae bacterium]|nr:(d)CMP kinase [Oscillospiraceae bacterium]
MIAIAIDGPSGAGKSTLAKRLARELGYIYVDTGAMYRTIGLYALRNGADLSSERQVSALLPHIHMQLKFLDGEQHMYLNGEDVSLLIRTEAVSMAASAVSAHPPVRAFLLDTQRDMAKNDNVLMDGRDIGTVVLPDAPIKIFLTASAETRARRRYEELIEKGQEVSYEAVLDDINRRDYNDSHRDAAPLKQAEDAVRIDTSGMELEDSFQLLLRTIREKLG